MPEGVPFFRRRVGGESSQSLVNGGKMIRTENISESEEQRMNKKIFKRAVAMMMAAVLTVGAALPSSNVFASGSDEEKDIKTLAVYVYCQLFNNAYNRLQLHLSHQKRCQSDVIFHILVSKQNYTIEI